MNSYLAVISTTHLVKNVGNSSENSLEKQMEGYLGEKEEY